MSGTASSRTLLVCCSIGGGGFAIGRAVSDPSGFGLLGGAVTRSAPGGLLGSGGGGGGGGGDEGGGEGGMLGGGNGG